MNNIDYCDSKTSVHNEKMTRSGYDVTGNVVYDIPVVIIVIIHNTLMIDAQVSKQESHDPCFTIDYQVMS